MIKTHWTIVLTEASVKDLRKIEKSEGERIQSFLYKKFENSDNPRIFGKKLTGLLAQFWSYRVGDYRIIAKLKDNILIISIIRIGHRKEVYEKEMVH